MTLATRSAGTVQFTVSLLATLLVACTSEKSNPVQLVPPFAPESSVSEGSGARATESGLADAPTAPPTAPIPQTSEGKATTTEAVVAQNDSGTEPERATAPDASVATNSSGTELAGTFRVRGRDLFDACGQQVMLRGINEMIVWSDGRDGIPEFSEIAKTGANVVRIVWTDEGSPLELDQVIVNATREHLIPLVEHHGATGNLVCLPLSITGRDPMFSLS